jgi:hypothetical protein
MMLHQHALTGTLIHCRFEFCGKLHFNKRSTDQKRPNEAALNGRGATSEFLMSERVSERSRICPL